MHDVVYPTPPHLFCLFAFVVVRFVFFLQSQTRQRMSAMYMEDDEIPGADVNDVRANLRAALRKNQVRTITSPNILHTYMRDLS